MLSLALGTVQLGLDYGIANCQGKPSIQQAQEIVDTAINQGIEWFDTAMLYGDAESVLGKCLEHHSGAKIITKVGSLAKLSKGELDRQLDQSLESLQVDHLDGFMLHDANDIAQAPSHMLDFFFSLENDPRVNRVGLSVYTPEQARAAIDRYPIRVIQVPSNILNHQFLDAGLFAEFVEKDIISFTRSIFLQGLFFMSVDSEKVCSIPGASEALSCVHDFCEEHDCSISELVFCDAYNYEGSNILMGAENAHQITQNISSISAAATKKHLAKLWKKVKPDVSNVTINPSLWGK